MGVVISLNPRAPPWHGSYEDRRDVLGKGNGLFPGLCMLDTATLASIDCQSNVGLGMEQNRQNTYSVHVMLTLNFFPTIPVVKGCSNGGWRKYMLASLRSPVPEGRAVSSLCVRWNNAKIWAEDGHEKWRKIGDHKEDLRGIPACKEEIGNWAVVITGCGIDVVPINQNCWINKNCSRFFCHGAVQNMFQTLSSSIACYVPIPTAMSWQNSCLRA